MRKMITLLVIALISGIFAMCAPKKEIPVESNWALETICTDGNEISVPEGHSPYLAFLADHSGDYISPEWAEDLWKDEGHHFVIPSGLPVASKFYPEG